VKVALNTLSLTLYMDRNQFNIQTHFFIRQCIFFSEFKPVTKNNMGYIVSAVVSLSRTLTTKFCNSLSRTLTTKSYNSLSRTLTTNSYNSLSRTLTTKSCNSLSRTLTTKSYNSLS
jgi:hypothetical protein